MKRGVQAEGLRTCRLGEYEHTQIADKGGAPVVDAGTLCC
jgi:hypothetical protein